MDEWIGYGLETTDGDVSMWTLIRGGFSALITELGFIIGYIVLPFSLAIFTICFVFWGCVLYVLGPPGACDYAQLHTWAFPFSLD